MHPHPFTQLFCTDVGATTAAANLSDALEIAYKIPLDIHSTRELDEEVRSYYTWMFEEAHRQWNAPDTPRLVAVAQPAARSAASLKLDTVFDRRAQHAHQPATTAHRCSGG